MKLEPKSWATLHWNPHRHCLMWGRQTVPNNLADLTRLCVEGMEQIRARKAMTVHLMGVRWIRQGEITTITDSTYCSRNDCVWQERICFSCSRYQTGHHFCIFVYELLLISNFLWSETLQISTFKRHLISFCKNFLLQEMRCLGVTVFLLHFSLWERLSRSLLSKRLSHKLKCYRNVTCYHDLILIVHIAEKWGFKARLLDFRVRVWV